MRNVTIAAVAALSLSLAACGDPAAKKKDEPAVAKKDGQKKAEGASADGDPAAPPKDGDAEKPAAADPVQTLTASIEAWNAGDFDKALAGFSDDVQFTMVGGPAPASGKDAIKSAWENAKKAFPDMKVGIERIVVGEDTVAMHLVSHGTHKGEFHGQAPTDKEVGAGVLYVLGTEDGKFNTVTAYMNQLAYMSQIGASPEGMPPVPVPAFPEGEPQVIKGEGSPENVKLLQAWHQTFLDGTSLAKIDEFLAPDGQHHDVSSGEEQAGIEASKKNIGEMVAAFSDIKIDTVTYAAVGDYVFATGRWSAKHTGQMGPVAATNKELAVDFAEIALVKDGKLAESWGYSNPMQMMVMLGLAPAPGQAPKPDAVAAK